MTCLRGGGIVICSPDMTSSRRVLFCPWCQTVRRFRVDSFEWYAPDMFCTWCGTHFHEDGYQARMAESTRDRNRAYAREVWR